MPGLIEAWRRFSMHPAVRPLNDRRIVLQWRLTGRPIPPPPTVKASIVKAYQHRFGPRVFVETGTFAGGMIDAVRDRFERITSLELDPGWHARAVQSFRGQAHTNLLQGDSGVRRRRSRDATELALFWLDAITRPRHSEAVTARFRELAPSHLVAGTSCRSGHTGFRGDLSHRRRSRSVDRTDPGGTSMSATTSCGAVMGRGRMRVR